MKKRLKKFKPPLPALHECLVSGPAGSSSDNYTGKTTVKYQAAQWWYRSGFQDGECPDYDEVAIRMCRYASKVEV